MSAPRAHWHERGFTSKEKLSLALEIVGAYSRARWLLWRTDLPATVTALRAVPALPQAGLAHIPRAGVRLAGIVERTLGHLPLDSRCLMRSLVLTSLLARRGIGSTLVIAVASEPRFHAHAWVESEGVALLEPAGPPFSRILEV